MGFVKMLYHERMLGNLCRIVEVCDFYGWLKLLEAYSFLEKLVKQIAIAFLVEKFLNGLLLITCLDQWIILEDFDSHFDLLNVQEERLIFSLPLKIHPICPFHPDEPMHN